MFKKCDSVIDVISDKTIAVDIVNHKDIDSKISNLQNQLVEIDQEINNFNKPMSDEEIMRIGEQFFLY